MPISPLQEVSQTYERAVDQVMIDHRLAMVCRDVEELISLGLGLFESYERVDALWREGVRRGDQAHPLEHGLALKEVLDRLLTCREKVLGLVCTLEQNGYDVDGAMRFRNTRPIPFDERPLDVHFADSEFEALSKNSGPDPVYASDDEL